MNPITRLTLSFVLATGFLLWAAPVRADTATHVIQPGETLFRIALNHGVTVDALRAANGILGNTIYAGQTLIIPAGATITVAPASDNQTNLPVANSTHVAQRGENLFRIGLKYGVSVAAIQTANGITGNTIYVGQQLIIPNSSNVEAASVIEATPHPVPEISSTATSSSSGNKRFAVDLSEQRLYAYEGDTVVRTTLVSTGLPATPTVTGTFYIYLRYPSQRMRGPGYGLPGVPYVQYFYKGYGLHGTYWHNNFGQPMSHGCVNMPTPEAEWAYNWAGIGTPVIVQQ
jgi:lipoprotein-anchoring transpeptidase ErfK/SrfK